MGAPQSPPPYEVAAARQRLALAKKWESSLRDTLAIAWRQVEQATRGLECAREQVKEAEAKLARGGATHRRAALDDEGGGRKRGIKGRAFALVTKSLRHKGSGGADARKKYHNDNANNEDTDPDLAIGEDGLEDDDVITQTVQWKRIRDAGRPLSRSVVVTKSSGSEDLVTLARRGGGSHNLEGRPRTPSQRSLSHDDKESRHISQRDIHDLEEEQRRSGRSASSKRSQSSRRSSSSPRGLSYDAEEIQSRSASSRRSSSSQRGDVSCDAEEAQMRSGSSRRSLMEESRRSSSSRRQGGGERASFRRLSTRESHAGSGDDCLEEPLEGEEQQKHHRGSQRDLSRGVEELQRRSPRKSREERSSRQSSLTKGSHTGSRDYDLAREEEDREQKLKRKLKREGYKKNSEIEYLERLARKLDRDKMERNLERADKKARRSSLKKQSDGSSSRALSHSSARDSVPTKDKSLGHKSRSKSSSLERSESSRSRSGRSKGGSLERSDSSRKSRSRSDSSQKSRAKDGGPVRTKSKRGTLERTDSGRVPRSEGGSLERDEPRSKSGGSLERDRNKDNAKKRRKRRSGGKRGANRQLSQSLKVTKSKSKRDLLHKSHKERSTKVISVSDNEDDDMQRLVKDARLWRLVKEARRRQTVDASVDSHQDLDKLDVLGKRSSSGSGALDDLSASSPDLFENTPSIRASVEAHVASGSQSLMAPSRSGDLRKSDDALDGQEPRRGLLGDIIADPEGNNSSDEAVVRSTTSLNDEDNPPGQQETNTTTSPAREIGRCTSGPVQAPPGSAAAQPRRSPALRHRTSDVNAHSGSDLTESDVTVSHSTATEKRAGGKGPAAKGVLTQSIKELRGMIVLEGLEPPVSPG